MYILPKAKFLILFLTTTVFYKLGTACSPPAGPVTYILHSNERPHAYIEMGRTTVFGRKATVPTDGSPPISCSNAFHLSYESKLEVNDSNKKYNEAVKGCSKLFQLYLASSQNLTFSIFGSQYEEDIVPHCKLEQGS